MKMLLELVQSMEAGRKKTVEKRRERVRSAQGKIEEKKKEKTKGNGETGNNGNKKKKGDDKPSNKPYKNNKEANKQAQKQGYKDAHELKEDYVGKDNVSKYDIKYDTKTGEIYLENKNGTIQIPTGLINQN